MRIFGLRRFASADGLLTWDLRPLTYGTPRVVADMIFRLNWTAWALQKPNLSKSAIFQDGVLEPEVVFPRLFSRLNRVFSIVSGCGEPMSTNSSKAAIFQDGILQPEVALAGRFSRRRRHFSIELDCLGPPYCRFAPFYKICWMQTSTYFTLPLLSEH